MNNSILECLVLDNLDEESSEQVIVQIEELEFNCFNGGFMDEVRTIITTFYEGMDTQDTVVAGQFANQLGAHFKGIMKG